MLPWSSLEKLRKLKNKVAPNMLERPGWQKAFSNYDQANSNTGVSMVRTGPLCSRMIFCRCPTVCHDGDDSLTKVPKRR
jgi:hypothetical protein